MGNSINNYFDAKGNISWSQFSNSGFYFELTDGSSQLEIYRKVYERSDRKKIFESFLKKIMEKWEIDYISASLLIVVKDFIQFIVREGLDYSFFFCEEKEEDKDSKLLIPCRFLYKDTEKIIHVEVTNKNTRLSEESLLECFDELREDLKGSSKILKFYKDSKEITIKEITDLSLNHKTDVLVDPFSDHPTNIDLTQIEIKVLDYDPHSVFSIFFNFLFENIRMKMFANHPIRTHATFQFMLACFEFQLCGKEKAGCKELSYSPVVYFLRDLNEDLCKGFSVNLLDYVCELFGVTKKISYFRSFFVSSLDVKLAEIEEEGPVFGLYLLALINCYGRCQNMCRIENYDLQWGKYYEFFVREIKNSYVLLVFSMIFNRNHQFYTGFLVSNYSEQFVLELIKDVYLKPSHCFRLDLIFIIFLRFSESKFFNEKMFKKEYELIDWVSEYYIKKANLGSLLFLSVIKAIKENFRTKQYEHVQQYTTVILFNISPLIVNLHEVSCFELVNLIKGLYSIYKKNSKKAESEKFKDFLSLYLEITCKILKNRLDANQKLIKTFLSNFSLLKNIEEDIQNRNLSELVKCFEIFEKTIESSQDSEYDLQLICKLQDIGKLKYEVVDCEGFKYVDDPIKWEEFTVPYLWKEILLNTRAINSELFLP